MTAPDYVAAWRASGRTAEPLTVVSETIGDTRKVVTFDREITREEFGAWLAEERRWYQYFPQGYGGHWSVRGNIGEYTHWTTCD